MRYSFSNHMITTFGADFFFAGTSEFMRCFKAAFWAGAYIITACGRFLCLLMSLLIIEEICAATQSALFHFLQLGGIVKEAAAIFTVKPFAVKVDLTAFNNYLFAKNECLGNFLSCLGINARKCWS